MLIFNAFLIRFYYIYFLFNPLITPIFLFKFYYAYSLFNPLIKPISLIIIFHKHLFGLYYVVLMSDRFDLRMILRKCFNCWQILSGLIWCQNCGNRYFVDNSQVGQVEMKILMN
ncbi:hypothetical protein C1645_145121 [Glomus cerebriforme]|uniref:Uncharacterized protein n=1 Tax=Glomus cerebriforme TaxID=658196 RepID=A0A397T0B0_9GLOM|nr:hypothetical protein C1645_145121 [Glomus cerebriforme]